MLEAFCESVRYLRQLVFAKGDFAAKIEGGRIHHAFRSSGPVMWPKGPILYLGASHSTSKASCARHRLRRVGMYYVPIASGSVLYIWRYGEELSLSTSRHCAIELRREWEEGAVSGPKAGVLVMFSSMIRVYRIVVCKWRII